jgi:hypothetical protein
MPKRCDVCRTSLDLGKKTLPGYEVSPGAVTDIVSMSVNIARDSAFSAKGAK